MLFRAAFPPVLGCGNHRVRGTPGGSGAWVTEWECCDGGRGKLSESLEKRRGMTSERPGSAALALGAGAAGPGSPGRGLKLKENEIGGNSY